MTLTGTYSRNLDEKQRLAVPKPLREQFKEGKKKLTSLYVAPGTENSLFLYSPASFERLAEQSTIRQSNRAEVQNYRRLFYAQAEQVTLDSQGRIRIPERLVALARLEHDIVLLGVQDHAEIWNRKLWDEFLDKHTSNFDDFATQALE